MGLLDFISLHVDEKVSLNGNKKKRTSGERLICKDKTTNR
jgi:hypothetical protein